MKTLILVLPLAVKIYPFSRAGQLFFFKFGASINALTNSQEIVSGSSTDTSDSAKRITDRKSDRTSFDVQGIAGLGIIVNFT